MSKNDGEYLQDKLHEAGKLYEKKMPAMWHRFFDTKSARGHLLPAQPGDFMLLTPWKGILIEAKSTDEGTPLLSLIQSDSSARNQVGKHRIWHRTGHPSYYIWADIRTKEVRAYRGYAVVSAFVGGGDVEPTLTSEVRKLYDVICRVGVGALEK